MVQNSSNDTTNDIYNHSAPYFDIIIKHQSNPILVTNIRDVFSATNEIILTKKLNINIRKLRTYKKMHVH